MNNVKSFVGNKIIMAIVSIVLGIVFIVAGESFIDLIITVIGIVLIVAAGVFLLYYFISAKGRDTKNIVVAIICAVIGILFLIPAMKVMIIMAFPFVLGVILIGFGTVSLVESIKAPAGTHKGIEIAISLVVIALGLIILIFLHQTTDLMLKLIGIGFLINGVVQIVGFLGDAANGNGGGDGSTGTDIMQA